MKKLLVLLFLAGPAFGAATTNQVKYGTNNQAFTMAVGTLNNIQSVATAIDNTSNLFLDALVVCKYTTAGSGTSTTGTINIYAAGTANGGTDYSDGVGASSATVTLTSPPNVRLIGICNAVANSTTYTCGPYAASPAFSGVLPDHWTIVVENKTGGQIGSGSCFYQGVETQNQ